MTTAIPLWSFAMLAYRVQTKVRSMKLIIAVLATCILASAGGCASLESNRQWYRTLPDPCAGRSVYGAHPLCGAPPP